MKNIKKLFPILTVMMLLLVSLTTSCDRREPPPVVQDTPQPPPPNQMRIITKITASPDTIYCDNNITFPETR